MIRTAFSTPWEIRTPTLTRYLEKEFTDAFFEKGQLRISSFKNFRRHADENRGDLAEGSANIQISTPNGTHAISAINGQEAYVLCAGTVESRTMEASFQTQEGFRILQPLSFADAISRHIPGFSGGMEGLCHYKEHLLIEKTELDQFPPPDAFPSLDEWSDQYDLYVGAQMKEALFLKHIKFSHQGEYRFIWFASGAEKEHIDITCPEAVKFCQRLNSL
ncbi:hypothetical protein ACVSNS_01475 [Pseudomonas aeruginosa]